MPKKTRREKVLAKERRLKLLKESQREIKITAAHKKSIHHIDTGTAINPEPTSEELLVRSSFISDFKKSLLYVGIIIALEIGVYFGTINN